MFELEVERDFRAAHAITMGGRREPSHRHDWHVSVVVSGERLDADGVLVDFHVMERKLADVVDALGGRDLNRTPPFDEVNPTAEHVARHIARSMDGDLPPGIRLRRVSVTEAPGCTATYEAPRRDAG